MEARRNWLRSPIVGGVVGVFAGGLTIFLLEAVGHALFGTADPSDLSSVTTAMFAAVLVGWVLGSAVAGALATYWAQATKPTTGVVVGLVLLAAAGSNMLAFPHPVWMIVSAVVLMPAAATIAARATLAAEGE